MTRVRGWHAWFCREMSAHGDKLLGSLKGQTVSHSSRPGAGAADRGGVAISQAEHDVLSHHPSLHCQDGQSLDAGASYYHRG